MEYINHIFAGTALLSLFSYLAYQLRGIPLLIRNFFERKFVYRVLIEEGTDLYDNFRDWLNKKYSKRMMSVMASLDKKTIVKDGVQVTEQFLSLNGHNYSFFIKYKGLYILVSVHRERIENANSKYNAYIHKYHLTTFLGKKTVNDLLDEVISFSGQSEKKPLIYTWYDSYWLATRNSFSSYGEVFLKEKEKIFSDIEIFSKSFNWYERRGIPYKRGYLFYGNPGNGKTSIVRELSAKFFKNVYLINSRVLKSDEMLEEAFAAISENSIVLMEDADALIPSNRKVHNAEEIYQDDKKGYVSLSAVLNVLDGLRTTKNLILIMTTNHIEKFDSAVIREGRIDVKVEFKNPDKDTLEKYLSNFFEREVTLDTYSKDYSMAKIQEICISNKDNLDNVIKILS